MRLRATRAAVIGAAAATLAGCIPAAEAPPAAAPVPAPAPPPPLPATPARPPSFDLQGAITQGGFAIGSAPAGTDTLTLAGKPVMLAPDRRFVIGFGRDAPAEELLVASAGGREIARQRLAIAPRQWDIQSLPTLPKGTTPSPEFVRRRAAEVAQINAARAMQTDAAGWQQRFIWPATGRISGVFGSQRIYAGEPGAFHAGVDIARPTGTPVVAPADGVVILAAASPFSLEGNLLMVDHGMGLNSAFLHLSRIEVKLGDHVSRGQEIGLVGMTGRATGPHLHWALKWQDERIDPVLVAGPMPPP